MQLRDSGVKNDPSAWKDYIGLESLHPLYANDKGYQELTKEFVKTLKANPAQMADIHRAYDRDKKVFGTKESFDKWLPRVQAQEYIRGGIFTKQIPGWVGPKGEGRYTPEQMKLLDRIKQYLSTSD